MGNAEFKRHHFKLTKKLATVTHYEHINGKPHPLITSTVKFTADRAYSNATGQLYWLHLRGSTKWGRPITGLRCTLELGVYYGDIQNPKKSLLLFQFSSDWQDLIIDVFPSFYPSNKGFLEQLAKNHNYFL